MLKQLAIAWNYLINTESGYLIQNIKQLLLIQVSEMHAH